MDENRFKRRDMSGSNTFGSSDRNVVSVYESIKLAECFLQISQSADGAWRDFYIPKVGESDEWVTAYVARAVLFAMPGSLSLPKANRFLKRPGCWSFRHGISPDADSTANALLFLFDYPIYAMNEEAIRARFLNLWRKLGSEDHETARFAILLMQFYDTEYSGFRTYLTPPSDTEAVDSVSSWCDLHLCVTALAGEAALKLCPPVANGTLGSIGAYLLKHRSRGGEWEAFWWEGRGYATYAASRFLYLIGKQNELTCTFEAFLMQQATDGFWTDIDGTPSVFETSNILMMLSLQGVNEATHKSVRRGLEWLLQQQARDGSWPSSARLRVRHQHASLDIRHKERVISDSRKIFTTATALRAIAGTNAVLG